MAKLVIIFNDPLSKEGSHLNNYHRLISNFKSDENGKKCYQGLQLNHFKRATGSGWEQYLSSVANIGTNIEERFSDIKKSAIFENIESILDTFIWPFNRDCGVFDNDVIKKICELFKELLVKNGCNITKVPDCILLSCHFRISERVHTLYLPECQGTPCSKQVQSLKFK